MVDALQNGNDLEGLIDGDGGFEAVADGVGKGEDFLGVGGLEAGFGVDLLAGDDTVPGGVNFASGPGDRALGAVEEETEVLGFLLVAEPGGFQNHGGAVVKMDEAGGEIFDAEEFAVPLAPSAGDVVAVGEVDGGFAADADGAGEIHEVHGGIEGVNPDVHAGSAAAEAGIDESG